MDRRNFLRSGGLVLSGFVAGGTSMWMLNDAPDHKQTTKPHKKALPKGSPSMSELSKSHFDACLGEQFTIEHDGVSSAAKLAKVDGKREGRLETFSIVFEVPGAEVLPQSMRKISHAHIGVHELFLVPIGNDGKVTQYEAVFTRLIGEEEDDV